MQPLGVGGDFHAFFDGGDAGGEQAVLAFDFDQTHAAGADIAEAIHFAEARNEDAILAGDVENGFFLASAEVAAVDLQGFDRGGWPHAGCLSSSGIAWQTPAGH